MTRRQRHGIQRDFYFCGDLSGRADPLRSADRVDVRLPGPVGAGGRAAADDRGQGQHLGLHRRGGRRPDRGDPDGGTAAQRGAGLPLYPAGNGGGGVCGLFGLVQAQVRRLSMENKIRALRSEMGLSQEELARRCGVSRQTINAIENQKYDPSLPLAFQLARILGTTVDALFLPKLDA